MTLPALAPFGLLCAVLLTSGCAIVQNVRPVAFGTEVQKVYVQENPRILMSGFIPEVVDQIKTLGFQAEVFSGELPAGARHHLTLTANWRWDMAMYLHYFQATLHEDGRVIGTAEYDARKGGGNLGKFGHTAEKIKPLLSQLLKGASISGPAAMTVGGK